MPLLLLSSCGQKTISKDTKSEQAASLEHYYEQSLTIEYDLAEAPHYSIMDYDNEIVDIDFSKSRFFNTKYEEIFEEYVFSDKEIFRMYSEIWFASAPRDFIAIFVFVE